MTEPETLAALLESAADRVEASPGTNVLDALRDVHAAHGSSDETIGDVYYALWEYLPTGTELVAPWSDRETSDTVAATLRRLARTTRRGGPARIPARPVSPGDLELVARAGSGYGRRKG